MFGWHLLQNEMKILLDLRVSVWVPIHEMHVMVESISIHPLFENQTRSLFHEIMHQGKLSSLLFYNNHMQDAETCRILQNEFDPVRPRRMYIFDLI